MKIAKPKKTAPLIIEDVIVDGKKKISVRIESPRGQMEGVLIMNDCNDCGGFKSALRCLPCLNWWGFLK